MGTIVGTIAATGERAIGAAAVQLPDVECDLIRIRASNGNSGDIFVGGSGVTAGDGADDDTTGYQLDAGQEIELPVRNASQIYVIASAASQAITFICIQ